MSIPQWNPKHECVKLKLEYLRDNIPNLLKSHFKDILYTHKFRELYDLSTMIRGIRFNREWESGEEDDSLGQRMHGRPIKYKYTQQECYIMLLNEFYKYLCRGDIFRQFRKLCFLIKDNTCYQKIGIPRGFDNEMFEGGYEQADNEIVYNEMFEGEYEQAVQEEEAFLENLRNGQIENPKEHCVYVCLDLYKYVDFCNLTKNLDCITVILINNL